MVELEQKWSTFAEAATDALSEHIEALRIDAEKKLQPGLVSVTEAIIELLQTFSYEFALDVDSSGHRKYCSCRGRGSPIDAIAAFDLQLHVNWGEHHKTQEPTIGPVRTGGSSGFTLDDTGRPSGPQVELQALLEGRLTEGILPYLDNIVDNLNEKEHAMTLAHVGEISFGPLADDIYPGPHEILYTSERSPGLALCCTCIATWSAPHDPSKLTGNHWQ